MPRFPKKEAEILSLAEQLIAGLRDYPAVFPNPPHPAYQPGNGIRSKVSQYNYRREDLIAARAVAEQTTAEKDDALEELIEALKDDIRYAENTVDFDDDKLKLVGWAGKKVATPLAPPGQVRLLEAPKQGKGWVFLDWKAPAEGSRPKAYKVQRRLRDDGSWQDVATAILTKATLVDQPQKQELEYRIIAINKAGEGEPSNTVQVVL